MLAGTALKAAVRSKGLAAVFLCRVAHCAEGVMRRRGAAGAAGGGTCAGGAPQHDSVKETEEEFVETTTSRTQGREKVRQDSIIKIVPGERFTPYTLARKLGAKMVLESSSFQKGKERYSLLMAEEAFKILQRGDDIFMESDGRRLAVKSKGKDILDVLLYFGGGNRLPLLRVLRQVRHDPVSNEERPARSAGRGLPFRPCLRHLRPLHRHHLPHRAEL